MHSRIRLMLLATTAAACLGALTASASARSLSTSTRQLRVTYRSMEFRSLVTIRCEVTLEGSFHTLTMAKVLESLVGNITRATGKHPCTGGEGFAYNGTERLEGATLANSLPWHLRYAGFEGTLPNITRFRISLSGSRLLITAIGVRCILTGGPVGGLFFGTATRNVGTGVVDNLVASGRTRYDAGSSELCGSEVDFSSQATDGAITQLGTGTRITITLI